MVYKLSIIGSGNWGTVVANIASRNIVNMTQFMKKVHMWVYPEQVNNRNLIDIINQDHENVKYLPGIPLPENLYADGDLASCVKDADFLVFILPHQFLDRTCATIKPHLKPGVVGISFIKGLFCSAHKIELVSQRISHLLGIPMCVVSGANVANEIAQGKFAEATLGFNGAKMSDETITLLQRIFSVPTLRITPIEDIAGVEISGALKNIVALAAGFVDGLGYGSNTKAAILRLGMIEIQNFAKEFFDGIKEETFWQSSGFADLITTCYAGRNRKCAEEFVKTSEDWDALENRMLGGQKLQGPSTCQEVHQFLKNKDRLKAYPLFEQIYLISFGIDGKKVDPHSIIERFTKEDIPKLIRCKY